MAFSPLGPRSSDDEEGSCELPDGRIVCGAHGLVCCGRCCTDYSDMNADQLDDEDSEGEYLGLAVQESEDEEDDLDSAVEGQDQRFGLERTKGTGRVFPVRFTPPSNQLIPGQLFDGVIDGFRTRYIRRGDASEFLIFTDGACLGNGQPNPRAGWSVVYGPGHEGEPMKVFGRLETQGPFGGEDNQTSNRAELRATIAALRFLQWAYEGFKSVVIATDPEYVVQGSTAWIKTWMRNGWKTSKKEEVKNRDLWEMLLV